jgi:hypothetical protein
MSLITGFRTSLLIAAVAELHVADALAEGPLSCAQLAARTGAHADSLYRVLRALATYGIFEELDDGRFALTPLAGLLRSDVDGSLRDWARWVSTDWFLRAWWAMVHTLRTGETAFDHVHGMPLYDYLAGHPDASEFFSRLMAAQVDSEELSVVARFDFSDVGTVVDVGGAHGAVLASILAAHAHLRGILFDLPGVVAGARPHLEAAGIADRCRVVGGDFFRERLPRGGDVYLLSRIIHNWHHEQAVAILANCREAMDGRGKLLLVEEVIPPGNAPDPAKLTDIAMLVIAGGRERTEAEYRTLLLHSGFRLSRVVPTQSDVSVIEATPVQ